MRLLTLILISNSLLVGGTWFYHHFLAPNDGLLRITFRLMVFGAVAIPCLLWWKKRPQVITLSLGMLLSGGTLLLILLFLAQAYLFPAIFPELVRYAPSTRLFDATLHLAWLIGLLFAGYTLFSLALFLLGKRIVRLFPRFTLSALPDELQPFVLGAIGAFGWILILHLLDWTAWLSREAIWTGFVLLLLAEWRTVTATFHLCRTRRFSIAWPGWISGISFSLLFFLVVLQLGDSLRPAPTGYDDMTHYLNQVELMSERAELMVTHWPAAFETLLTGFSLALPVEGQFFPLSLGSYGILIGTLLVFLIGRHFLSLQAGTLAATTFLSVPMTGALSVMETKPDSFLMPLILLSLGCLLVARERRDFSLLPIIAFLLGLATTVKLTAFFFAPAVIWFAAVLAWQTRARSTRILTTVGLSLCLSLLPWLPWAMHTAIDAIEREARPVVELPLREEVNTLTASLACKATGSAEDFARFETPHRHEWLQTLALPWDITMNTTVRSFATEIGWLWLAVLPWYFLVRRQDAQPETDFSPSDAVATLAFTGSVTLLGWAWLGHGVSWYFFPVLGPLALSIAWTVDRLQGSSRFLTLFIATLFLASLVSQTVVRMKFSLLDAHLRYGVGEATITEYIDTALPGYAKVRDYANLDPEARMIVTGSRSWYGISNNDRRAVMDQHLDIMNCLLSELGEEATARKLRELNIRYILFSKDQVRQMRENTRPTFAAKVRAFTEFSALYLRPVWGSESHLLFEIASSRNIR